MAALPAARAFVWPAHASAADMLTKMVLRPKKAAALLERGIDRSEEEEMFRWQDGLGMYNTLNDGEVRSELRMIPRLAQSLVELPPALHLPEGSWQHELRESVASDGTGGGLPLIQQAAAAEDEADTRAARMDAFAQQMARRSVACLTFLGTGAMKPSAYRNVSLRHVAGTGCRSLSVLSTAPSHALRSHTPHPHGRPTFPAARERR